MTWTGWGQSFGGRTFRGPTFGPWFWTDVFGLRARGGTQASGVRREGSTLVPTFRPMFSVCTHRRSQGGKRFGTDLSTDVFGLHAQSFPGREALWYRPFDRCFRSARTVVPRAGSALVPTFRPMFSGLRARGGTQGEWRSQGGRRSGTDLSTDVFGSTRTGVPREGSALVPTFRPMFSVCRYEEPLRRVAFTGGTDLSTDVFRGRTFRETRNGPRFSWGARFGTAGAGITCHIATRAARGQAGRFFLAWGRKSVLQKLCFGPLSQRYEPHPQPESHRVQS